MVDKLISFNEERPGTGLPDVVEGKLGEKFADLSTSFFDTFEDVPDGGLPTTSESGHNWTFAYDGKRTEVRDGRLRQITSGDYPEILLDRPVSRIGCVFTINDEGGTLTGPPNRATLSLNSWDKTILSGQSRTTRAHIFITMAGGVSVAIREAEGGILTEVSQFQMKHSLELDTEYTFEWIIVDDTVHIFTPDGSVFTVQNPAIGTMGGEYANWQMISKEEEGAPKLELVSVWADGEPAKSDGAGRVAGRALEAVARSVEGAATPTEYPTKPLVIDQVTRPIRGRSADGVEWDVLIVNKNGATVLTGTEQSSPISSIRMDADGNISFVSGAKYLAQLRKITGTFHHFGIVTIDFYKTSVVSEEVSQGSTPVTPTSDASRGSLLLNRDATADASNLLWQRTGANVWQLVGHPSGTTDQRPTTAPVGFHFFDTTVGKPIWLKATPSTWVDATGEVV